MIIPENLVDLHRVDNIPIVGKGGLEKVISALLPCWNRACSALYDYETEYNGKVWRLEIKRQQNLQWFDSGKYYLLSEQNREIVVLLVNHSEGRIESIAATQLGSFVDLLISLPQYQLWGWTEEVMRVAAEFKIKYPALQFKAKAQILPLMKKYPDYFQILFRRQTVAVP